MRLGVGQGEFNGTFLKILLLFYIWKNVVQVQIFWVKTKWKKLRESSSNLIITQVTPSFFYEDDPNISLLCCVGAIYVI